MDYLLDLLVKSRKAQMVTYGYIPKTELVNSMGTTLQHTISILKPTSPSLQLKC